MGGPRSLAARAAVVATVLASSIACTFSVLPYLSDIYYLDGPEMGLEVLEVYGVGERLEVLGAMEAAMMRLELGDYAASRELARRARAGAAALASADPALRGTGFVGEPFERVWTSTVAVLASLALQEVDAAAGDAERLVADLAECGACEDPFSRLVASTALAAAGRREEAFRALAPDPPAADAARLWAAEKVRLGGGDLLAGALRYLPPPGGAEGRRLEVLLLLGHGPVKLPGQGGEAAPRWDEGWSETAAAVLVAPMGTEVSWVQLTGMAELARGGSAAATGGRGAGPASGGMLGPSAPPHWSTLPAAAGVIRIALERETEWVELRYLSPGGEVLSREVVELPPSWSSGPLFVVRRLP